jgi:HlyD family secretion protein
VRLAGGLAVFGAMVMLVTAIGCGDSIDVNTAHADEAVGRQSLVALARLEPASRVVNVASATTDVVKQILVREGNEVVQGQVLVLLESYPLRAAELEAARIRLERANLQPLEVEAQRARVRAIEAELEYARDEVDSQKDLSRKGFSAGKEFRDAQLRVRRAEEQLAEANAVLERLEANSTLEQREARNSVVQSEAKLEQTMVRSPLDGTVLRVLVREGERVASGPVMQVGTTQSMYAVAEVHANEIRMVEEGMPATFTSPALHGPIEGTVETVGTIIAGNYITGEDPSRPRGLRVVEVRVRLEDNELARRLTNLEGELRIHLDAPRSVE